MKRAISIIMMAVIMSPVLALAEGLPLFFFDKTEDFKAVSSGLDPWVFPCELTKEHVVSGNALKVIPKKGGKWVVFKSPQTDWSSYDYLKIECFNPGKRTTIYLCIADAQALPCTEEYAWSGYPIARQKTVLSRGQQTIQFPVKKLATIDSRPMNMKDVKLFGLGFDEDDREFVINNIRLEREEEQ